MENWRGQPQCSSWCFWSNKRLENWRNDIHATVAILIFFNQWRPYSNTSRYIRKTWYMTAMVAILMFGTIDHWTDNDALHNLKARQVMALFHYTSSILTTPRWSKQHRDVQQIQGMTMLPSASDNIHTEMFNKFKEWQCYHQLLVISTDTSSSCLFHVLTSANTFLCCACMLI
jgi:hypothetical protein